MRRENEKCQTTHKRLKHWQSWRIYLLYSGVGKLFRLLNQFSVLRKHIRSLFQCIDQYNQPPLLNSNKLQSVKRSAVRSEIKMHLLFVDDREL